MPEMPAFLANLLVPSLARPATVVAVDDVAPSLRIVRFAGKALQGVEYFEGQEVEFRVSAREFRHYTPLRFDSASGTMEIAFFLHGRGPGCEWARSLDAGNVVQVLGPGGNFGLRDAERHVLLGDETTLGLFSSFAQARPEDWLGAIEGGNEARSWPGAFELHGAFVRRGALRGDALLSWLEEARLPVEERTCFYLVGHAGSILRLRSKLRQLGWPPHRIRTKAYWADEKRGL